MNQFLQPVVKGTVFCLALLLLTVAARAQSTNKPVDPEAVREAIRKGVAYLYSRQSPEGHWETVPQRDDKEDRYSIKGGQWGGQTALITYALLAAGESHQDPRIRKAVEWLAQADIQGIYALGMRAQIWQYMPRTPQMAAAARRDWMLLADALQRRQKNGIGTYDYLVTSGGNRIDLSVSQYGVLGVWALAEAGVEVPPSYWQVVDNAWREWQTRAGTGGWAYHGTPDGGNPINLPITAAGVATLFITQDYLHANAGVRCNGNITNPHIEAGLAWMIKNIDGMTTAASGKNKNPYYTLYGVERIGVASGLKYFGTTDWYQVGARWLLSKQNTQGAWNTGKESRSAGGLCDNAFALIFLARGSAPVAFNKLEYDITSGNRQQIGHWNQRPRDIANVIRWMGRQRERDLNWQIVNLKVDVDELLDAPILYIAGNQQLSFTEEERNKLKEYVELGGMIVGHADCGDSKFANSFRRLGQELFGSEFQPLPDDHIIYTIQFPRSQMRQKPRWLGLSNGARELMILITEDSAKSWQMQAYGGNEAAFQMMMNLYLYAIDRVGEREKGQTYMVKPDPKAVAKRTLRVGRGQYAGPWNPEPGGWRRLAAILLNEHAIGVDVQPVDLNAGEIPSDLKVLHLTGTVAPELNDAAKAAIRKFVEGGGTLVLDAAGGRSEFATAGELLVQSLWPEKTEALQQPLKMDHPLYSAGGKPLAKVQYRSAARRTLTGDLNTPRLRGIEIDGRLAVILSREDLSVGLVGMPVEGIIGYEPDSATELMKRILMYAAN